MSEFAAIREMLAACGGNRVETAKRLGISERTLRYRLAKAREQGEEIIRPSSRRDGMSVGGVGGAMSVDRVMALRAQILNAIRHSRRQARPVPTRRHRPPRPKPRLRRPALPIRWNPR